MAELPTLLSATYSSNVVPPNAFMNQLTHSSQDRRVQAMNLFLDAPQKPAAAPAVQQQEISMSAVARIIKVFIADPNENMPLEKRVLYTGDEKLTDLTDQELFFEVPISDLLAKHNAERIKTIDKTQATKFGRDIFLEPAKIRDLKMVVVTVATF